MLDIAQLKLEMRGLAVRAFLKDKYQARRRRHEGSDFVYDVYKLGTNRVYTVRFQFVRLAFMKLPSQYRSSYCNCPRFYKRLDCQHILLAIDAHGESEKEPLSLEIFGRFNLAKTSEAELKLVVSC